MPPAPSFSASDFLAALQALMPRGKVWPKDSAATQTQVLQGLAMPFQWSAARANNLLVDAFPATADELLPEWEATLGLPDPCAGESPSLQARQAQVVARFAATGGQSVQDFIDYAATLGFAITITQYTPFRVGQQAAGDPIASQDWAFAWSVNAPAETVTYFAAGRAGAGQPLASWGNAVLECEIRKISPAHTVPIFSYQ